MTRVERAERHKLIAASYKSGLPSREVARRFGLNDSHVRYIARLYGVARPAGRPRA